MRVKELIKTALFEERCQKKHSRLMFIFMMAAMVWFVGIHSLVGSIKSSMEGLLNKPNGRILYYVGKDEEVDEFCEQIKKDKKQYPMIEDVFYGSNALYVNWNNSDGLLKQKNVEIQLFSYFSGIKEYLTDAKVQKPNYNEVIIPKYLYSLGIFDEYNYADGEALVGKTISLEVENEENAEILFVDLKVIGTYDNIKGQCETNFLINDEQMVELYFFQSKISEAEIEMAKEMMASGSEDYQIEEQIQEYFNGDEQAFWQDYFGANQKNLCFYLADGYDMEESAAFIQEKTTWKGFPLISLDSSLITYFEFIIYMGNLTSSLFLAVAFVNVLITVSAEVRRRKGEFALKQAIGYTKKDIFLIFMIGKFWCLLKAAICAFVITGIVAAAGNYMIQMIFPFYLRYVVLSYDVKAVVLAVAAVVFGTGLGMGMVIPMIKKICVAQVLKKEG